MPDGVGRVLARIDVHRAGAPADPLQFLLHGVLFVGLKLPGQKVGIEQIQGCIPGIGPLPPETVHGGGKALAEHGQPGHDAVPCGPQSGAAAVLVSDRIVQTGGDTLYKVGQEEAGRLGAGVADRRIGGLFRRGIPFGVGIGINQAADGGHSGQVQHSLNRSAGR